MSMGVLFRRITVPVLSRKSSCLFASTDLVYLIRELFYATYKSVRLFWSKNLLWSTFSSLRPDALNSSVRAEIRWKRNQPFQLLVLLCAKKYVRVYSARSKSPAQRKIAYLVIMVVVWDVWWWGCETGVLEIAHYACERNYRLKNMWNLQHYSGPRITSTVRGQNKGPFLDRK